MDMPASPFPRCAAGTDQIADPTLFREHIH